jgi:tetratricopeptide (TPR) repeat protein
MSRFCVVIAYQQWNRELWSIKRSDSYENLPAACEALNRRLAHPYSPPHDTKTMKTTLGKAIQVWQSLLSCNVHPKFTALSGLVILLGTWAHAPQGLAQQQLDAGPVAASENCLDLVYQNAGEQAIETCQQAIALNRMVGEQRLEAYSLGNLGTIYLQQQNYQQALTVYTQALEIAQSVNDPALVVRALVAVGTAYSHLGETQQALGFYQQAVTLAEASGDGTGTAIAFYNLGLIYDALAEYESAIDAYQNATTVAQGIGDPILEGYAITKLKLATEALAKVSISPAGESTVH